jgi:hypothetical protein
MQLTYAAGVYPEQYCLMFNGLQLVPDITLASYGIEEGKKCRRPKYNNVFLDFLVEKLVLTTHLSP